MGPHSKIISLTPIPGPMPTYLALCEDGSVWTFIPGGGGAARWRCLTEQEVGTKRYM